MKAKILFVVIIINLYSFAHCQTYSATPAFLTINPYARAAGMGNTGTGLTDAESAMYWNPAGLVFQKGRAIDIAYSKLFPDFGSDIYFYYTDFKTYLSLLEGNIGIGVMYFNQGEFQVGGYNDQDQGSAKTMKPRDIALVLSYGTYIHKNISVGLTFRYIQSQKAMMNLSEATTYSYDIGLLYQPTYLKKTSIGINIANLGPEIKYSGQNFGNAIPTMFKFGIAYKLIDRQFSHLVIATDFNKMLVKMRIDDNANIDYDPYYKALFTSWGNKLHTYSMGIEYWYSDLLSLRMGFIFDNNRTLEKFATFGFSLRYGHYGFDLSYMSASKGHPSNGRVQLAGQILL